MPLTPTDVALLREKYPEGLICTSPLECGHRLIATTRAGYSRSGRGAAGEPCALSEAERLAFVCADCRQTAVAAVQLAESRRATLAAARAVARQKREPSAACTVVVAARTDVPRFANEVSRTCKTVFRDAPVRLACGRAGRPGRPRVERAKQRRKAAERAREYRHRQRAKQLDAADAMRSAVDAVTE